MLQLKASLQMLERLLKAFVYVRQSIFSILVNKKVGIKFLQIIKDFVCSIFTLIILMFEEIVFDIDFAQIHFVL